jgi:hypothetical protein
MCDREAEAEVSPRELEVDVTREDDLLGMVSETEVVSGIGASSAVGSGVGTGGGEVIAAVDAMDILREWGWCDGIELEPCRRAGSGGGATRVKHAYQCSLS